MTAPSQAQTSRSLLLDEFGGTGIETTNTWFNIGDGETIGRTRRLDIPEFRNIELRSETVSGATTTFARFKHRRFDAARTYRPNGDPRFYFTGCEIKSKGRWYPYKAATGYSVIEYVTRLRVPKVSNLFPAGLVAGFFSYGADQVAKDDEIDIEFLGTKLTEPVTPKQLWLNVWDDAFQASQLVPVPTGVDVAQWQTYKISWSYDRIDWQVLIGSSWRTIRTALRGSGAYPSEAQHVHLNVWAPPNDTSLGYGNPFPEAANMGYTPTTDPAQDVTHYFDVDRVSVTQLTYTTSSTSGTQSREPLQSPAPLSSVSIESIEADASTQTVRLKFTGALDAAQATAREHYYVTLGGVTRTILSAEYDAATTTVLLRLRPNSLTLGGEARVAAYDLVDSDGLSLPDQFSRGATVIASS